LREFKWTAAITSATDCVPVITKSVDVDGVASEKLVSLHVQNVNTNLTPLTFFMAYQREQIGYTTDVMCKSAVQAADERRAANCD
jgi:hypothetical protein